MKFKIKIKEKFIPQYRKSGFFYWLFGWNNYYEESYYTRSIISFDNFEKCREYLTEKFKEDTDSCKSIEMTSVPLSYTSPDSDTITIPKDV